MLKLKLQYFGHLMRRVDSLEKSLILGGIGGRRRRGWQRMTWLEGNGLTEYEKVGWYHRLNEHEFEKVPKVGDGLGSLLCCSPWGHKQSDTTE